MLFHSQTVLAVSALVASTANAAFYIPAALQSGPDYGSTYALAAEYSEFSHSVVITGKTWGRYFEADQADRFGANGPDMVSDCFVTAVNLPKYGDHDSYPEFYAKARLTRTDDENDESCNALHLYNASSELLVAGSSEGHTELQGMLKDFGINHMTTERALSTHGEQILEEAGNFYPTAVTTMPDEDGYVYVAGTNSRVTSDDSKESGPFEHAKYTPGHTLVLAKYALPGVHTDVDEDAAVVEEYPFDTTWVAEHGLEDMNNDIYVNDLMALGDGTLLVAGSTNGYGAGVQGAPEDTDMDGYITLIEANSGELVMKVEPELKSVYRLKSIDDKDDVITQVCEAGEFTAVNGGMVYVVGYTDGELENSNFQGSTGTASAFVMKLDTSTMQPVWTRQLGGTMSTGEGVKAMACAYSGDGSIWVGGIVGDNDIIPQSGLVRSNGGQDIFVARYSESSGDLELMEQIGTSQDDEMALRGGLVADREGNAVVVGNTYGSMYRERTSKEKSADVFVMTIYYETGEFEPAMNSVAQKGDASLAGGDSMAALDIVVILILCAISAAVLFVVGRRFQLAKRSSKPAQDGIFKSSHYSDDADRNDAAFNDVGSPSKSSISKDKDNLLVV